MSEVLFVYGTLMPGQPRWDLLRRYAADPGWAARVPGYLFDTGQGYPAARFDPGTTSPGTTSPGTTSPGTTSPGVDLVTGHCVPLLEASSSLALAALDRYEEVDLGLYSRIRVTTAQPAGTVCWAYTLGPTSSTHFPALRPIRAGDWAAYRARCT